MSNQVEADTGSKHHNEEHNTKVKDVSEYFVDDINQRRNVIIHAHVLECFLNHKENNQDFSVSLKLNLEGKFLSVLVVHHIWYADDYIDDELAKEENTYKS